MQCHWLEETHPLPTQKRPDWTKTSTYRKRAELSATTTHVRRPRSDDWAASLLLKSRFYFEATLPDMTQTWNWQEEKWDVKVVVSLDELLHPDRDTLCFLSHSNRTDHLSIINYLLQLRMTFSLWCSNSFISSLIPNHTSIISLFIDWLLEYLFIEELLVFQWNIFYLSF